MPVLYGGVMMGDGKWRRMTGAEVRSVQGSKGRCFSAKFISDFCYEWDVAVQRLKKSGAELDAIVIVGK